jgi:hypothetical protein
MHKSIAAMIGLIAGLASWPLAAQTGAVDEDLRCIAIAAAAAAQLPADKRAGAMAGIMYFYGRVDARAPDLDFGGELKRVANALNQEIAKVEAKRCSAILVERAERMQRAGAILKAPQ